ncbi:Pimeloyl-ACP methyl ester carboxylesterase [Oceanobacillus limi]|uniref:Pimeloyl-ACP methyl ester carboxylesterase n=1 Tax=Oceanobacillus limi TaxID=930131 RepID=A0A1I0A9Y8_9BACI|nr:alpha/beta hydrolase [Oceanobacillus limi]SES90845.1 Pimeloyl-ACP methyl ester carboxylesterase [Oceanobacillus limi]
MILHTEVSGSGEAIVFLHTGLQTGKTELDLQREYFKQKYKVILPDLRGHGKSVSNNLSDYFHRSAKDLAETLEELGLPSAHIVGCSLGGLVGLVFAKNHPDMVKSLTLSSIIPEKPADWEKINQEDVENTAKIVEDPDTANYFNAIHDGDWKELLHSTQNTDWYPFDETADLSMLNMPILFIVGEQNEHETIGTITYPKTNENIHVSIIPFAGHVVHLDQPEMYNKIVEGFFQHAESPHVKTK